MSLDFYCILVSEYAESSRNIFISRAEKIEAFMIYTYIYVLVLKSCRVTSDNLNFLSPFPQKILFRPCDLISPNDDVNQGILGQVINQSNTFSLLQ